MATSPYLRSWCADRPARDLKEQPGMNLSATHPVAAPAPIVFARMSDLAAFERAARGKGISVERTRDVAPPAPGLAWRIGYDLRGKRRETSLRLDRFDPPRTMVFSSETGGLTGDARIEIEPVGTNGARVTVSIDLAATSLTARLLLQSLKLARGQIEGRLDDRLAKICRDIERRSATTA